MALRETVLNGGVSTRGEPSKGTVTNVERVSGDTPKLQGAFMDRGLR